MKREPQVVMPHESWKLEDFSDGKMKGYMRITKNGKRVADVFPYAPDQDPAWTVKAAQEIVDKMNQLDRR